MSETLKQYWAMPSTRRGLLLALGLAGLQLPVEAVQYFGEAVIALVTAYETLRKEAAK